MLDIRSNPLVVPGQAWPDPGFALYVHWPFCKAKCPYCDFNSHVRREVDHAAWRDALCRELAHAAGLVGRRPLRSIFFGGGTPSLMEPATAAAVIDMAAALFPFEDGIEITLEANPTSVEADRFAGFRHAGVNRVSLGVQALDEAPLRFLGREHSAKEAMAAVELAQHVFPRFSFDLIYGRPGQTVREWEAELGRAIARADGHLSLYQLTIEQGTRFATLAAQGTLLMPDDEMQADFFAVTQDVMAAAGLPAYEISNHARAGEESRHNLVYWRYGDYVGIGPGAHGRLTLADGMRVATRTERLPERWLRAVEAAGSAMLEMTAIAPREQFIECLMMGMRLREGVPLARLDALEARALDEQALRQLEQGGFLERQDGWLRATATGRPLLNALLERLIEDGT